MESLQFSPKISRTQQKYTNETNPFSVDDFLKEFETFDCNRGFDDETGKEIFDNDCL